jgi:peptidylprolyl isomerase
MSRSRAWALVALTASVLGLAGCSSSPSSPSVSINTSATTTTAAPTTSTTATSGGTGTIAVIPTQDRSPAGTAGTAPTVVVPSGAPPTQLESADLIAGTGAQAQPGDSITVQYVLATYSARKVIQSSWTSSPFTFTLGEGQVIKGWDQGVVGLKVGGRRELIIPPSLGYGANSPGAGIASNDTLVFVVDLLKVN